MKMKENREKSKLRHWVRILIVLAILALVIGIVKAKAGDTDADQVLTIAEQGFEGHYYDAGEREKVVITFSGSEGGSSASDTMAWYYKQNGISALGVTLFAGEETGENLDRVPLEYVENAVAWLKHRAMRRSPWTGSPRALSTPFSPRPGSRKSAAWWPASPRISSVRE